MLETRAGQPGESLLRESGRFQGLRCVPPLSVGECVFNLFGGGDGEEEEALALSDQAQEGGEGEESASRTQLLLLRKGPAASCPEQSHNRRWKEGRGVVSWREEHDDCPRDRLKQLSALPVSIQCF